MKMHIHVTTKTGKQFVSIDNVEYVMAVNGLDFQQAVLDLSEWTPLFEDGTYGERADALTIFTSRDNEMIFPVESIDSVTVRWVYNA